jgi:hypothetical protein
MMIKDKLDERCTYNIKVWRFSVTIVAMETQQWRPFALLSTYKIFLSAVNSIKVLSSSCRVLDIIVHFKKQFGVS